MGTLRVGGGWQLTLHPRGFYPAVPRSSGQGVRHGKQARLPPAVPPSPYLTVLPIHLGRQQRWPKWGPQGGVPGSWLLTWCHRAISYWYLGELTMAEHPQQAQAALGSGGTQQGWTVHACACGKPGDPSRPILGGKGLPGG